MTPRLTADVRSRFFTDRPRLLLLLACSLLTSASFAQLQKFPIQRNTTEHSPSRKTDISARQKNGTLTLPFWDDFSNPDGLYPDTLLWQNSASIWVNNGMAINQPTLYVATFDGLDSLGAPYNPTQVLEVGYTDRLTSQPIDLSATPRDAVFLSFYFQWQGNGEAPDGEDFLEVEYKNVDNAWESIMRIVPQQNLDRTLFYDTVVRVGEDRFFHNAFQFRFRSYGRESGPYDTWNLDYVYLNANRDSTKTDYPDRAMASVMTSPFGPYYAIPYNHFQLSGSVDTVYYDVGSLQDIATSVTLDIQNVYRNYMPDSSVIVHTESFEVGGFRYNQDNQLQGALDPYERATGFYGTQLPDPDNAQHFNPLATGVDVELNIHLVSGDENDAENANFAPIDFRQNDNIAGTFYLRDYYAYDDGSAEFAAGLIEAGNQAAYKFELLSVDDNVFIPDTLIGFDIYFPPYGIAANQLVTFFIYDDENGEPGSVIQQLPPKVIPAPTIGNFTRVSFLPAIRILKPTFYIGWRQPVSGKALVGLDISNDTGDRIYVNATGEWYQSEAVRGSLMIRPIFGHGIVDDTQVGLPEETTVNIYPNPSRGSFTVEGPVQDVRMTDITGKNIAFSEERAEGVIHISTQVSAGLYILRMNSEGRILTKKILIKAD